MLKPVLFSCPCLFPLPTFCDHLCVSPVSCHPEYLNPALLHLPYRFLSMSFLCLFVSRDLRFVEFCLFDCLNLQALSCMTSCFLEETKMLLSGLCSAACLPLLHLGPCSPALKSIWVMVSLAECSRGTRTAVLFLVWFIFLFSALLWLVGEWKIKTSENIKKVFSSW